MSQILVTGEAKIRDIQGPVVANSGVVTALDGDASQYVRGDGTLADFPTSTGGGSSVSYYLNSSVSQGTIGGVAYRQLSKTPISGAGTDITISANGYIASYITDANDPALLEVPAGNFNCEFYFSVNNNTGNPFVYAEVYKYDGTTFTLLGSSVGVPEFITQGTTIAPYYFAIPVAQTVLTITDRIAIRIYVNVDGRTVTLHTENNHLCQVVTTFSKGLTTLNNLTRQVQFLATGTSGTDFNISSSTATHTFNIPSASATNRGLITTGTQTIAGDKTFSGSIILNGGVDINNSLNVNSGFFIRNNVIGSTLYTSFTITKASNIETISYLFSTGFASNLLFNDSASYSYSFPTASGTVALLERTQTFSGVNTFSLDISVNSLTIGRGAGAIASNTVVGASALPVNTTGTLNTAIGNFSLLTNTTGYGNTSVGHSALAYNTTGFFNAAIGINALLSNTTGTYNNALGTASLYNNTTGSNNTAVGQVAGTNNTTGSNNTYIGFGSGGGITTGSNNTIIGQFTGTAAMANNIVLADGAGNVRYQWNGTNNVFGNPISGTSSTFSSSVTALSIIKSGGTSSQFLMADGSVNTSVLPSGAYLPLAGGTLTGALSGTSATFSSTITVSRNDTGNISMTLANAYINQGNLINFQHNSGGSTTNAYIGHGGDSTGNFVIINNGITPVSFARSTGAATFSSSVGINGVAASYPLYVRTGTNQRARFVDNGGLFQMAVLNDAETAYSDMSLGNSSVIIKSGGNVGIGTSSPNATLSLYGASTAYMNFRNSTNISSTYGFVIEATGNESELWNYASGYMRFGTANTERMRITSGGNVLIGTTTDSGYKLDVNGTGSFSGALTGTSATFSARVRAKGGSNLGGYYMDYQSDATSRSFRISSEHLVFADFVIQRSTTRTGTTYEDLLYFDANRAATFYSSITATSFFESSDSRLKTLITDNYQAKGIENVTAKLYVKNGKEELGYYAQDLQEILPSAVIEGDNGFLTLSYSQVHTLKIAHLEKEIAELKELIKTLL